MNRKEFEIWHKWCEWLNVDGECGLLHEKCNFLLCPNVLVIEMEEDDLTESRATKV